MEREWNKTQRIGFSVRDMTELQRVVRLGANMVEIKVEKFARAGTPIYEFNGKNEFWCNEGMLGRLTALALDKNFTIQWHLPVEGKIDPTKETGFNMGVAEHCELYIERFLVLESIYQDYGIGNVITLHPPTISIGGEEFLTAKKHF